jgi:hypothetical protein
MVPRFDLGCCGLVEKGGQPGHQWLLALLGIAGHHHCGQMSNRLTHFLETRKGSYTMGTALQVTARRSRHFSVKRLKWKAGSMKWFPISMSIYCLWAQYFRSRGKEFLAWGFISCSACTLKIVSKRAKLWNQRQKGYVISDTHAPSNPELRQVM